MSNRFIKHVYKEEPPANIEKDIIATLENTLSQLEKYYPQGSTYSLTSKGSKKTNSSMYIGAGGNILLYYKLALFHAKSDKSLSQAYLEKAFGSLNANFMAFDKEDSLDMVPSFLMGPPGLFSMGVLIYKQLQMLDKAKDCYTQLLEYKELLTKKDCADEVLYGAAGYLYSLMLVYDPKLFDNESICKEVFEHLIKKGLKSAEAYKVDYLYYPFSGKPYLGGAHGLIGVLYMLICACIKFQSINEQTKNKTLISNALNALAKMQFESGNFPSSIGSSKDELVHFCHGAPGAVFLFAKAYELFNDKLYLDVAIKAGNCVWEKGILMKGNGLCHGITGNSYALNALYKTTKDMLWRKRCLMFALATYSDEIQLACKNYKDPMRKVVGTADTPYSLMEGCGGTICYYIDILGPPEEMMMPGFEICN